MNASILWVLLLTTTAAASVLGIKYLQAVQALKKTASINMHSTGLENSEVFANVIHELKTPLCVILGAIQLIEQKKSSSQGEDPNIRKHFHTIRQSCFKMLKLVCNLLDITRLESGYTKLNSCNWNIVSLTEEITQSVIPYACQKNQKIIFDAGEEEIISAVDSDKFERILLNLLSNAIKFSPADGKIHVKVRREREMVLVSILDEGPGIPADKKESIFERFQQVNGTLTRLSEGSGIGLSLVKAFVELHNGSIRVESEDGKGSEFIVELPFTQVSREAKTAPPAELNRERITEMLHMEFSHISL